MVYPAAGRIILIVVIIIVVIKVIQGERLRPNALGPLSRKASAMCREGLVSISI